MDAFQIDDYRDLIQKKIKEYAQGGYGVQSKLAQHLGIHSSVLTGVLKSERQLTPEQAFGISQFFGMGDLERDYFIELVNWDRAGVKELKQYHQLKLDEIRKRNESLKDRSTKEKELTGQNKAVYYSDWRYSAIRVASLLPKMNAQKIAKKLAIDLQSVNRILEFLIAQNLVVSENDLIKMGPKFTRVRAEDPLVYRHHTNWRLRAIDKYDHADARSLHITAPFSVSEQDAKKIRKSLQKVAEQIFAQVEPSDSEELWCLNLDFFNFEKD